MYDNNALACTAQRQRSSSCHADDKQQTPGAHRKNTSRRHSNACASTEVDAAEIRGARSARRVYTTADRRAFRRRRSGCT